jgi:large conductance mechanosensitive channel
MSSLLKEFKDFLMRGNLIELAVAFVMGLAFAAVVNSLVVNLVMPIIAAIVGKPDFRDLTFTIHKSVFRYGSFITDVIQFVSIAAAVFFFIVKPVQSILARTRRPAAVEEVVQSDEERRHQELLVVIRGLVR